MKTIVIYASMSGTTAQMAQIITEELEKEGQSIVVKDAYDTFANELENYERIIVGSHTWGYGELSDEILDLYDELLEIDLTGKYGAVFGPGDSSYELFAEAVDILERTLTEQGCQMITEGLKVDSWTASDQEMEASCITFAKRIVSLSSIKEGGGNSYKP